MKDLVTYFDFMSRVIMGTASIDNQRRSSFNHSAGGKKLQPWKTCIKCKTSFGNVKERMCPFCHEEN